MTADEKKVWGESYVPPHNTALQRAFSVLPKSPGPVLEIGCGAGRFLRTIRSQRDNMVAHGCDLEPQAIIRATSYEDGINYLAASATALPYAGASFGLVLVFDVIEHLPDPEAAIEEIGRVLRPGGMLHVLVPCEGQPLSLHWWMWKTGVKADLKKRHVGHIQRFSRRKFLAMIEKTGLRVDHVSYSMHPFGQVRDVASYLAEEPLFAHRRLLQVAWQPVIRFFWLLSYFESKILAKVPVGAVALHVTAKKA